MVLAKYAICCMFFVLLARSINTKSIDNEFRTELKTLKDKIEAKLQHENSDFPDVVEEDLSELKGNEKEDNFDFVKLTIENKPVDFLNMFPMSFFDIEYDDQFLPESFETISIIELKSSDDLKTSEKSEFEQLLDLIDTAEKRDNKTNLRSKRQTGFMPSSLPFQSQQQFQSPLPQQQFQSPLPQQQFQSSVPQQQFGGFGSFPGQMSQQQPFNNAFQPSFSSQFGMQSQFQQQPASQFAVSSNFFNRGFQSMPQQSQMAPMQQPSMMNSFIQQQPMPIGAPSFMSPIMAAPVVAPAMATVVRPAVVDVMKPVVVDVVKPVIKDVVKPVVRDVVKPVVVGNHVVDVVKPVIRDVVKPVVTDIVKPVVTDIVKPVVADVLATVPIVRPLSFQAQQFASNGYGGGYGMQQQAPTVNTNANSVVPNTCAIGVSLPIWEGDAITETFCRCPDGSYGYTCQEGFGNPCANNDQQFFNADSRLTSNYFIHCSIQSPYLKKCPAPLVWDQVLTTCNWAATSAPASYSQVTSPVYQTPSYSAPAYSAPAYSQPAAAPSYSQPAAAPSYQQSYSMPTSYMQNSQNFNNF